MKNWPWSNFDQQNCIFITYKIGLKIKKIPEKYISQYHEKYKLRFGFGIKNLYPLNFKNLNWIHALPWNWSDTIRLSVFWTTIIPKVSMELKWLGVKVTIKFWSNLLILHPSCLLWFSLFNYRLNFITFFWIIRKLFIFCGRLPNMLAT